MSELQFNHKRIAKRTRSETSDNHESSVVIKSSDLFRLRQEALILCEKDEADKRHKEMDDIINASERHKKLMRNNWCIPEEENHLEIPEIPKKDDPDETSIILDVAACHRQEYQDRIKQLNKLLLNAKCQAIRDLQVIERAKINKELKALENEVDNLAIEHARQAQDKEEMRRITAIRKRAEQATIIKQQIEEKEELRRLEKIQHLKDGEKLLKEIQEQKITEENIKIEKKKHQQELLTALLSEKEKMLLQRKEEKEKEQRETLIISQKLQAKQENEAGLEEARQKQRQQFRIQTETEIKHKPQIKNIEDKKREESLFRQTQELKQREWRQQELEKLMKRQKTELEIHQTRMEQIAERERQKAYEAQREKDQLLKLIELQKKELQMEELKIKKQREARLIYGQEIKLQIQSNKAMQPKKNGHLEILSCDPSVALEKIHQAKIDELRGQNVPEKYIKDVEKHFKKLSSQS